MGIGIGWNQVEYTALNEEFSTRGRRVEEQVQVLRELWTEPLVTFNGKWHTIPDAGLNPLPVQRPIPLWFGGHAEVALRRCARWGAGWMPNYRTAAEAQPLLAILADEAAKIGRDRGEIGLEARIAYGTGEPETWRTLLDEWRAVGTTHVTINTMGCGFTAPDQHVAALRHFAETLLPVYGRA